MGTDKLKKSAPTTSGGRCCPDGAEDCGSNKDCKPNRPWQVSTELEGPCPASQQDTETVLWRILAQPGTPSTFYPSSIAESSLGLA